MNLYRIYYENQFSDGEWAANTPILMTSLSEENVRKEFNAIWLKVFGTEINYRITKVEQENKS